MKRGRNSRVRKGQLDQGPERGGRGHRLGDCFSKTLVPCLHLVTHPLSIATSVGSHIKCPVGWPESYKSALSASSTHHTQKQKTSQGGGPEEGGEGKYSLGIYVFRQNTVI